MGRKTTSGQLSTRRHRSRKAIYTIRYIPDRYPNMRRGGTPPWPQRESLYFSCGAMYSALRTLHVPSPCGS